MDSHSGDDLYEQALAAGLGAAAGLAGGPMFVVAGAVGAPIGVRLLRTGLDALHRKLSQREEARLRTVFDYIATDVSARWNRGQRPRTDLVTSGQWVSAEELLEGTLLNAQRQYQENKLKHIGSLLVESLFNQEVPLDVTFQYLNLADRLTYQQYQLLALFGRRVKGEVFPLSKQPLGMRGPHQSIPVMVALHDLFQQGLLGEAEADKILTGAVGGFITRFGGSNIDSVAPLSIYTSRSGTELHDLLDLPSIPSGSLTFLDGALGKNPEAPQDQDSE